MEFCNKCGQQLRDGAKFCPNCGQALHPITNGKLPILTQDNKGKKPKFFTKTIRKKYFCILLAATIVITISCFIVFIPFNHTVHGKIVSWELNDDCFCLNVDGNEYWLNYNGDINGYSGSAISAQNNNLNPLLKLAVGWNCDLTYSSCLLFPQGNAQFYANNIQLMVYP